MITLRIFLGFVILVVVAYTMPVVMNHGLLAL